MTEIVVWHDPMFGRTTYWLEVEGIRQGRLHGRCFNWDGSPSFSVGIPLDQIESRTPVEEP